MIKKVWMSYAHNRYVNWLLRFFPKRIFQDLHTWPTQFPWTEKRVTFCLSFDCDNPADADALPALLILLRKFNLSASFAACGAMVEENVKRYEQVVANGHEIINHGYSKHVEVLSNGSLRPVLFYDKLLERQIEEEIAKNHECLKQVLGVTPLGFRAPHFGHFQNPKDVELTYKLLRKYGYRYNSSTLMLTAQQQGLLKRTEEPFEFPLSSRIGVPCSVFDSWGFIAAPNRKMQPADFYPQFKQMVDAALNTDKPIFLNIYVDPSHVDGFDGFEACLQYIEQNKQMLWIGNYTDILDGEKDAF